VRIYRYANLLAILAVLSAGFVSVADQTKAFFAVPATETGGQPTISATEPNLTLAAIQPLEQGIVPDIAGSPRLATPKTAPAPCSGFYGYITIGGRNICLASTATTSGSLSYNHAYIYNTSVSSNQYIFGHNSTNIFASLHSLPSGTTFSVTLGGQTTSYAIAFKEVVCDYSNRDQYGPNYDCANYSEPVLNMNHAILPQLRSADLSLMTCAGSSIANGDATHRLVVYAKKI